MNKDGKSNPQLVSFYCIKENERFCEACYHFYMSVNHPTPLSKIIPADIRDVPQRLYKFTKETKENPNNKLNYFGQFIKAGLKHLLLSVAEADQRY